MIFNSSLYVQKHLISSLGNGMVQIKDLAT